MEGTRRISLAGSNFSSNHVVVRFFPCWILHLSSRFSFEYKGACADAFGKRLWRRHSY